MGVGGNFVTCMVTYSWMVP